LNLVIPLILLGLGYLLRHSAFLEPKELDVQLVLIILFVVSLVDLGVIYFLKKRLLSNFISSAERPSLSARLEPEKAGLNFALLIYALALAPSLYGLVYFLLGGSLNWFILFVAVTMLGFLIFKPKEEELKIFFKEGTTSLQE